MTSAAGRQAPIHPGEILVEEFLKPCGITAYRVAADCGLAQTRISGIIHGKRGITADTALALGPYFRTSPQFWMNLQTAFDLAVAQDRRGRGRDMASGPAGEAWETGIARRAYGGRVRTAPKRKATPASPARSRRRRTIGGVA